MTILRAFLPSQTMDLRFAAPDVEQGLPEDQKMTFSGYGSVFGNLDSYRTTFKPGAFTRTLAEAKSTGMWPALLSQHGSIFGVGSDETPVGIWTQMEEDGFGLRVTGKLAATPRGQELHTLMTMTPRPAISGLSIGFAPKKWENGTKPDEPARSFTDVDLMECSIVTFPANARATIDQVRTRDLERALRDAGLSRNEAKAVLSGGLRTIAPREVGDELSELLSALRSANGKS